MESFVNAVNVDISKGATDALYLATAYKLAYHTYNKFDGNCEGKFNRYLTADKQGNAQRFLVVFESDTKATVMTYEEALSIPILARKCKEVWGE